MVNNETTTVTAGTRVFYRGNMGARSGYGTIVSVMDADHVNVKMDNGIVKYAVPTALIRDGFYTVVAKEVA